MNAVDRMLQDLGVTQYEGFTEASDGCANRFVTLTNSGVHEEGLACTRYCMTESEAVAAYLEALQSFLAGRTIVFWRQRPLLEKREDVLQSGKPLWYVYSRLTAYHEHEFRRVGESK